MRKILAVAGIAAVASLSAVFAAQPASAEDRHCYTLGVPGYDHYEYCTYLPVDPGDVIR